MSVIHAPRKPDLDARTVLFPVAVGVALLVIFLRLWYIQVVKASELAERASFFRNTSVAKLAPRGLIYDRNGVVLAGVQSRFVLTAIPAVVHKNNWVLEKVGALLGIETGKLEEKVEEAKWKPYLPATIFVGVPIETAARIAEAGDDLPGIGIESQPMRYYPDSKSFSHVLGYVWVPNEKDVKRLAADDLKPANYVGKIGIEYAYERDLMGVPGADHLEVDAKRRPTRIAGRDNPVPGDRLTLALDSGLQRLAIEQLSGKIGAVVAIDPRNGEVLCLATNPTFDAGLFDSGISGGDWQKLRDDPNKPLQNRAISSAYAPGSTFKLITSLAAQEAGKFDPNRTVYCPGFYQVGKRKSKCLGHHGSIAYHEALVKSCNTYFSALAVDIGENVIRNEALACGLNAQTGIDVGAEYRGLIPTDDWIAKHRKPAKWYMGDTVNLGIGQGEVATTPLQMANLAALVGMNGIQFKPHLVKSIRQPNGQTEEVKPVISHQVEAPQNFWSELKSAMVDVVDRGTATKAKVPGFSLAGKTGSAEHGHGKETHGWFVGFAPAENPTIALCVFVEQGGHGGEVCAPIAGAIVKRYLTTGSGTRALANSTADASAAVASAALPIER